MKCPSCKYEHREFAYNKKKKIIGKKGDFFFLEKKRFVRTIYASAFETTDKAAAYACPNCGIVFIDMEVDS